MAGWVSSYHANGHTYNRGDALVLNGSYYYDITDPTPNGTLNNETRYFYGVFVFDDGSLPLNPVGISNAQAASSPSGGTIRFDTIVSGGTPDTFTYSFNANGGSGAPSDMTKTYGKHFVFPSTIPTRKGYIFNGWNNGSVNNGKTYAAGQEVIGLPDQDIIWWADWTPITYYIKYNGNGNTAGNMSNSEFQYDESGKLKANTYSKEGHSFNGWNTKSDGSGTSYANQANINNLTSTNGQTINLYAQWKINKYDLTVDPNGGVWNGNTTVRTYTQNYHSTKEIPDPQRTGYEFVEWELTGSGTLEDEIYTFGAGDGTLTAKWKRIVLTVTFDAETNGGTPNSTRDINYGDKVGSLPTPTKKYYKFVGWFTKAYGGTQISASQVITSNVTYYAQFKIDASVKIGQNGEKTPAIVWVGQNGVWSKMITWLGEKGIWNKSTGAD